MMYVLEGLSWRDAMNVYSLGDCWGVKLVIHQEIFDHFLCTIE